MGQSALMDPESELRSNCCMLLVGSYARTFIVLRCCRQAKSGHQGVATPFRPTADTRKTPATTANIATALHDT